MTRSVYQVPYFELTCAQKHALPHHVFQGARRPNCHDWCLEKQKKQKTFFWLIRSLVDPTLQRLAGVRGPLQLFKLEPS